MMMTTSMQSTFPFVLFWRGKKMPKKKWSKNARIDTGSYCIISYSVKEITQIIIRLYTR